MLVIITIDRHEGHLARGVYNIIYIPSAYLYYVKTRG